MAAVPLYLDIMEMPRPWLVVHWWVSVNLVPYSDVNYHFKSGMIADTKWMRYSISEIVRTFDIPHSTMSRVLEILDGQHYHQLWGGAMSDNVSLIIITRDIWMKVFCINRQGTLTQITSTFNAASSKCIYHSSKLWMLLPHFVWCSCNIFTDFLLGTVGSTTFLNVRGSHWHWGKYNHINLTSLMVWWSIECIVSSAIIRSESYTVFVIWFST